MPPRKRRNSVTNTRHYSKGQTKRYSVFLHINVRKRFFAQAYTCVTDTFGQTFGTYSIKRADNSVTTSMKHWKSIMNVTSLQTKQKTFHERNSQLLIARTVGTHTGGYHRHIHTGLVTWVWIHNKPGSIRPRCISLCRVATFVNTLYNAELQQLRTRCITAVRGIKLRPGRGLGSLDTTLFPESASGNNSYSSPWRYYFNVCPKRWCPAFMC